MNKRLKEMKIMQVTLLKNSKSTVRMEMNIIGFQKKGWIWKTKLVGGM